MESDSYECRACDGEGSTLILACGPAGSGLRELPCKTCNGSGRLSEAALIAYFEREGKRQQRRAARLELDLSMREMAKRLGVPVLTYNDYEHGRIDLPEKGGK